MKKRTAVLLLLLSAHGWSGGNAAEYSTKVHVSVTRMEVEGNTIGHHQCLSVVIDGKKYELKSLGTPSALLALGDYQAKLVRDEHPRPYDSWQVYEFMFPDGRTRQFLVVGRTE